MALVFHRLKNAKKCRFFKEKASSYQLIINKAHYNSYIIYILLYIKEKIQNLEKNFFKLKTWQLIIICNWCKLVSTKATGCQEVTSELCQLTCKHRAGQKRKRNQRKTADLNFLEESRKGKELTEYLTADL